MSLVDILIAIGSIGLVIFIIPAVINPKSQTPRKASIPTAFFLTYYIPLFFIAGLWLTAITVTGQAIAWWIIVLFRGIKK